MTTVVLADDQEMIRAGLRAVLESDAGLTVVGEAGDGVDAVRLAAELRPDVVLMDLRMPAIDGVEATRRIRADHRLDRTRVLVLTTFDGDAELIAALRAGSDGFLAKSAGPDELIRAVHDVAAGRAALSAGALTVAMAAGSGSAPDRRPDPDLVRRVERLTARERDVVIAVTTGGDNMAIAARLHISPFTVKTHLNRAMTKLGARDRAQVIVLAHQAGLVHQE
jgi:DNA-binding NarL/FixJ family response regulator